MSLTLLTLSRLIQGDPRKFDISTIQAESKHSKDVAKDFSTWCKTHIASHPGWYEKFDLASQSQDQLKFHWSTKKGPTGPAILSSY